ncbi:MAG: YiiD C-terminal domain-containing protein [Sedimentisphaerales bacterium]|nr:YiiD C-terminal domain-containing protein [Sedimentisphaerales bacterium]
MCEITILCPMENPLNKIASFQGLGITVVRDDSDNVVLQIPLAGNTNDKGTMFAGSIYSLMVMAGWKLAMNSAEAAGAPGNVVISSASVNYLRPIAQDCQATAELTRGFYLNAYGSGCCDIRVTIFNTQNKLCADFTGQYRILPEPAL